MTFHPKSILIFFYGKIETNNNSEFSNIIVDDTSKYHYANLVTVKDPTSNKTKSEYVGDYHGMQYNGKGVLREFDDNLVNTSSGEFINNQLYQGVQYKEKQISIFGNTFNLKIPSNYVDYELGIYESPLSWIKEFLEWINSS